MAATDDFIRNLLSLTRSMVVVRNGVIATADADDSAQRNQTWHTASTSALAVRQPYWNPLQDLGDITYAGSDGQLRKLGIGPEGYILMVVSGLPAWVAP